MSPLPYSRFIGPGAETFRPKNERPEGRPFEADQTLPEY